MVFNEDSILTNSTQPKKVCKKVSFDLDKLVVEGPTNWALLVIRQTTEEDQTNDPLAESELARGLLVAIEFD